MMWRTLEGYMRLGYVLSSIAVVAVAGIALAQSDSDYQGWMKSNAATMGSLNKNIAAKNGEAAAADAAKLQSNFEQIENFWKARGGADDAVNFAMKGHMAAGAVAKDASAGNFDQAAANVKMMQANCGGCHMAHREGSPGAFKIK